MKNNLSIYITIILSFVAAIALSSLFSSISAEKNSAELLVQINELKTELEDITTLKKEIESLNQKVTQLNNITQPKASLTTDLSDENSPLSERTLSSNKSENDDPFLGEKNNSLVVMVFSDFQSKIANKFNKTVLPLIKNDFLKNNSLKLIYRDFPLNGNTNAEAAAMLAQCSGEQGRYWEAFSLITENNQDIETGNFKNILNNISVKDKLKLSNCLNSERYKEEVAKDKADALSLGAKGAPSIFIARMESGLYKGVFIRGAQPYTVIKHEINKFLKK